MFFCVSSVLLVRGKAAKDFTGPDCRFLSFKKGETIYVYYKLSGQRSELWAGSVSNRFITDWLIDWCLWMLLMMNVFAMRHIWLALIWHCKHSTFTHLLGQQIMHEYLIAEKSVKQILTSIIVNVLILVLKCSKPQYAPWKFEYKYMMHIWLKWTIFPSVYLCFVLQFV